jgi:hypothetical protein
LLTARFGGIERLQAYVEIHSGLADADHERQRNRLHSRPGDPNPHIVRNSDLSNLSYVDYALWPEKKPLHLDGDEAYAHLLSIGQLCNVSGSESPFSSVQCDVSPHEWNDGTRFLAMRAGWDGREIHRGLSLVRMGVLATDPATADLVWVEDGSSPRPPIDFLRMEGDQWFAEYPRVGARMATGEIMHAVSDVSPIGGPVEVKTTVGGYHGFLKYDLSEVAALAPDGANAYTQDESFSMTSDEQHLVFQVQFVKVEIDRSRRILRNGELVADYDRMMKVVEARRPKAA